MLILYYFDRKSTLKVDGIVLKSGIIKCIPTRKKSPQPTLSFLFGQIELLARGCQILPARGVITFGEIPEISFDEKKPRVTKTDQTNSLDII